MKRIIGSIALFILSVSLFSITYLRVFKISLTTICLIFIFIVSYGFFMALSGKSMEKLKAYRQKQIHFGLDQEDDSKILLLSLTTLASTYFCVVLVSLIPLTYEAWMITVFPCILLNCLPASSVLDEYYSLTHKKLPFVMLFALLVIVCCFLSIIASHLYLK